MLSAQLNQFLAGALNDSYLWKVFWLFVRSLHLDAGFERDLVAMCCRNLFLLFRLIYQSLVQLFVFLLLRSERLLRLD